jgi:hypothetical protein
MKALFLLLFSTIIVCFSAQAQAYQHAVGIRFSNNDAILKTGISYRHIGKNNVALEALLSFEPVALGLMAEKFKPLNVAGLAWFYGGGAYVAFEGRNNLGALGIVGLDYKFNGVPINLSLDWKPELQIIRKVVFEPAAVGVGVRFAF